MILERGALLNNRYQIVEILGQGGMGSVYRAVDTNLGVEVAVKDNLFTNDDYARQFRREAVILANLRHPNLPRVTDHFVIENQSQYLVMDYIDGEDLRQRMDRVGVLTDEEAVVVGSAICDALTYLHSRTPSIIHRDIKPGNVKITPQGQIFLVDFGLAKVMQDNQSTTTGARAMTPGYSPPEQYGTARTDARSDTFSLGATLYAALTGGIPEDAMARAMEQCELTSIRKHSPHVSRRLASVIEKALEVLPDDRYQSAEEFKQALRSVLPVSRRRLGEITVTPSPELEDKPFPPEGILSIQPISDRPARIENRSPVPLPISTPLEEGIVRERPRTRARRRRIRMGCMLALVLTTILLAAGSLVAYFINPDFLSRPSFFSRMEVASPLPSTSTTTPTIVIPTSTPTTVVPLILPSNSPPPSPSATPKPSPTIAPTITPTVLPTLMGGGGGKIAFASDRVSGVFQIYVMNLDGSEVRQVTKIPEGACQPDWSPVDDRLVFISPCDGHKELYSGSALFLINLDGSGLTPLPTGLGGDYDPAWSPDGGRIAFTTERNGGRPRVYVLDLKDNSVKSLSDPNDPYSRDSQPAWSPDGKKIAFITSRRGPRQIWIMDANGKNQTLFSRSKDLLNDHPTWSPDGQVILFTQQETYGKAPRLVAASIKDQGLREVILDSGPTPMRDGKYSPDGIWIVYEAWPLGGNHNVFIMTANGAGRTRLTNDPRTDMDPTWKPALN